MARNLRKAYAVILFIMIFIFAINADSADGFSSNSADKLTAINADGADGQKMSIRISIDGICESLARLDAQIPFDGYLTVSDALKFISENSGIAVVQKDTQSISSVGGEISGMLGGSDGWRVCVNDFELSVPLDEYHLADGDRLALFYAKDDAKDSMTDGVFAAALPDDASDGESFFIGAESFYILLLSIFFMLVIPAVYKYARSEQLESERENYDENIRDDKSK